MHGPQPPHNPLAAAARETMAVARETKSPLLEKLAVGGMILSSVTSTAIGAYSMYRMAKHDEEKAEERAYKRLRAELEMQERARRPEPHHGRGR
jgi:hypothetical protein